MDEETYKQLLERIQTLEDKISATDKKVDDVSNFNRALLNTKEPPGKEVSKEEHKKELEKKLKEAIR